MKMFGFQRLLKKLGTSQSLFLSVYSEVLGRPIRLADFEFMSRTFMEAVSCYGLVYLDEGFDPIFRDDLRVFIASKMSDKPVALCRERCVQKTVKGKQQFICLNHVLTPSGVYHYELGYQDEEGQWFCLYDPYGFHDKGDKVSVIESWDFHELQYSTL